jgi:hypothetical protein
VLQERAIPELTSYPAIHQALDNILFLYDHNIFEEPRARALLSCLRLVSTNLRNCPHGENRANAPIRTEFRTRLRAALEDLRFDRNLKSLQRMESSLPR